MESSTEQRKAPAGLAIGRVVVYRSRFGEYDVPAIVNCTVDSISAEGVAQGHVLPLTDENCVHLTVFTPGKPGTAREGNVANPAQTSGCYQEWDIPEASSEESPEPGSWRWPVRIER